jgi:hypothetical protein
MWMYGGWDYTYSQQLWFLQWSTPSAPMAIASTGAQAQSDRATLQWQLPISAKTRVTIERSSDGTNWIRVGARLPNGLTLPFTDAAVAEGASYAWRAVVTTPGRSMASTPVWLTIPTASGVGSGPIDFGILPDARASRAGAIAVRCVLPARGAARVSLLDIAGRVRDRVDLTAAGPGGHRVELGRNLESGVFFVRLEAGRRNAVAKRVLLR